MYSAPQHAGECTDSMKARYHSRCVPHRETQNTSVMLGLVQHDNSRLQAELLMANICDFEQEMLGGETGKEGCLSGG